MKDYELLKKTLWNSLLVGLFIVIAFVGIGFLFSFFNISLSADPTIFIESVLAGEFVGILIAIASFLILGYIATIASKFVMKKQTKVTFGGALALGVAIMLVFTAITALFGFAGVSLSTDPVEAATSIREGQFIGVGVILLSWIILGLIAIGLAPKLSPSQVLSVNSLDLNTKQNLPDFSITTSVI